MLACLFLSVSLSVSPVVDSALPEVCGRTWTAVRSGLQLGYTHCKLHTIVFFTGKTSTIKACAKELYGKAYKSMVLEVRHRHFSSGTSPPPSAARFTLTSSPLHSLTSSLLHSLTYPFTHSLICTSLFATQLNASDDRGIGVVREQIKTFASTHTVFRYSHAKGQRGELRVAQRSWRGGKGLVDARAHELGWQLSITSLASSLCFFFLLWADDAATASSSSSLTRPMP